MTTRSTMSYSAIHKTVRERTVDGGPAIKLLRRDEWSMGNGQCPECMGCDPNKRFWIAQEDYLGHYRRCKLAKALEALGEKVEWRRFNRSPERKANEEGWRRIYEAALGKRPNPAPSPVQGTASPSTRPGKGLAPGSSKRGSTRTP